jgi:hypothetical protein
MKKEKRLNDELSDIYTVDEAIDKFLYLTSPNRGEYISERELREHYENRELGTLLKRLDPIAYNMENI